MKKISLLIGAMLSCLLLIAQPPAKMNYQSVVRSSSGQLIVNQMVGLRVSILRGSAGGTVIYNEVMLPSTNANGLLSVEIGGGNGFATIDWADGPYFLKTEIDPAGGMDYSIVGVSELLSVPYAMFARTASQPALPGNPGVPGDMLYWDGTAWTKLAPGQDGQTLVMCNGIPTWGGCTPSLTTIDVFDIDATSAYSGGIITNEGGSAILSRGVCWATHPGPSLADFSTVEGSSDNTFMSFIQNLQTNTTYYVRAYATNQAGTAYGNEISFTTMAAGAPLVITHGITGVTTASVQGNAEVVNDGGAAVTLRGVAWGTSPNPIVSSGSLYLGSGLGVYGYNITGLQAGTTYYIRAFATNANGTAYGNQLTVTTSSLVTDAEGNTYNSIVIGNQEWLTTNLRTRRFNNGATIPMVAGLKSGEEISSSAFAVYPHAQVTGVDDESAMLQAYGALYNWEAINDPRGICPTGWRVPRQSDWDELMNHAASTGAEAGNALKSCRQHHSPAGAACNTNTHPRWDADPLFYGTDELGFKALPGGQLSPERVFSALGSLGVWWSLPAAAPTHGWIYILTKDQGGFSNMAAHKNHAFSVRCIKN